MLCEFTFSLDNGLKEIENIKLYFYNFHCLFNCYETKQKKRLYFFQYSILAVTIKAYNKSIQQLQVIEIVAYEIKDYHMRF